MRIAVLAFDTRGGVQPYVALSLGLQQAGHEVTMITTADFGDLVTGHGVTFAATTGDTEATVRAMGGAAELSAGTRPLHARAHAGHRRSDLGRSARRSPGLRRGHGRHRRLPDRTPGRREAGRPLPGSTPAAAGPTHRSLPRPAAPPSTGLARRRRAQGKPPGHRPRAAEHAQRRLTADPGRAGPSRPASPAQRHPARGLRLQPTGGPTASRMGTAAQDHGLLATARRPRLDAT